jgi:hypothetical protein
LLGLEYRSQTEFCTIISLTYGILRSVLALLIRISTLYVADEADYDDAMQHRSLHFGCVLILVLLSVPLHAQNSVPLTPNELAAASLTRFKAANLELAHYAFDQYREYLYDDGTHKSIKKDTIFWKQITIKGMLYGLSFISNSQELTADEAKALNKMGAERVRLEAPLQKPDTVPRRDHLPNLLATAFQNRIVGHENISGHECLILESRPLPNLTDPEAQNDIRLSIDAVTFDVLRFSWQSLVDVHPAAIVPGGVTITELKGNINTIDFVLVNGTPLPSKQVSDGSYRPKSGKTRHSQIIDTYTNYQRFTATVIVGPATVVQPAKPQDQ